MTDLTKSRMTAAIDGGKYFEGPRWHQGRLWFVDCLARKLLSIGPSRDLRQHATFNDAPCGMGVLPDGRLVVLTTFRRRLLAFSNEQLSLYADLSHIAAGTLGDMVVDGLGRAYVGDLGIAWPLALKRGATGRIILVMPDGKMRVVAEGLHFPTGIAVSADHRRLTIAEMDRAYLAEYDIDTDGGLRFNRGFECAEGPTGICLDRDGSIWVASFGEGAFVQLDSEGRERRRINLPGRRGVACALGGDDRKTLFCLSAATSPQELKHGRSSARIDLLEVEAPGSGYP
ncbi:SMP-30/gluconolactonase/LRE family protein [Bradyrhizobium prioriisuperbiae]|uniref:SMP-30/gluconolactonase/LRE family protein n=1 Tax=Bradyrhizobium prioriisuperbiae TaxID=2854389 RepID=UPI0028E37CAA|nr:SMP-30/gluconolactonase/LRE family protein [Bradyrhizobium prioritasuperba]